MAKQDQQILEAIDHEIEKLQQARAILAGNDEATAGTMPAARGSAAKSAARQVGRPKGTKRQISPEARARIIEGQKKRWAKSREQQQAVAD